MPPANMKSTFFFNQNDQGFSESWYSGITPFSSALDQLCITYINYRLALTSQPCVALGYRNSLLPNSGSKGSYVKGIGSLGIAGAGGHGPGPGADPAYSAMLVKCYSANYGRTKSWYFRGFSDDWDMNGGKWTPGPGFQQALTQIQSFLSTNSWGWQGQSYPVETMPLVTVTQAASGQIVFTFAGDFPSAPAVGTHFRIRVSGVLGASTANGLFTVVKMAVGVYNTIDKISIFTAQNPSGQATLQKAVLIPVGPTIGSAAAPFQVLRLVSRKPGAIFFSSRGKRKSLLVRSR